MVTKLQRNESDGGGYMQHRQKTPEWAFFLIS